jgi:hypothetical protein
MPDRAPADSIDMRRISSRALVLLTCVLAMNCSGSDPTSPDSPPPSGAGGAGGGGATGGGGSFGRTAVTTDSEFNDNDWDEEVQAFGSGGSGSAGQLHFNGQAAAGYRQVTINVSNAGSGSAAQVAVFSIKRNATYFPSTDGEILWIDHSEDSIHQQGGTSQYGAPALRQNGKLYTLVPGAGAFAVPETAWTRRTLTNLRQNDFRTIASPGDHPDFSTSGGRIEVGFMRLVTVPAGGNGVTVKAGIDNWTLTFYRP